MVHASRGGVLIGIQGSSDIVLEPTSPSLGDHRAQSHCCLDLDELKFVGRLCGTSDVLFSSSFVRELHFPGSQFQCVFHASQHVHDRSLCAKTLSSLHVAIDIAQQLVHMP